MDPIGNIPVYISLLKEIEQKRSIKIIIREMLIALVIILIFSMFGKSFLEIIDVNEDAVHIAGGFVLFMISLKMIFPQKGGLSEALFEKGEPFIFPLAIPLVAGPSVLAAVMIYSGQLESNWILYVAITIAWFISMIILLASTILKKWLGLRGIAALERLMGLILMLIAINMILEGIDMHYGANLLKR